MALEASRTNRTGSLSEGGSLVPEIYFRMFLPQLAWQVEGLDYNIRTNQIAITQGETVKEYPLILGHKVDPTINRKAVVAMKELIGKTDSPQTIRILRNVEQLSRLLEKIIPSGNE